MNSFYVVLGSTTATIQLLAGTVVNNVQVNGVTVLYVANGNIITINLSGIPEGAHLVTVITNAAPLEAVMCIYDESVFFHGTDDHLFAKVIRTNNIASFNESISKSKLFLPAQSVKTLVGIPLQRMGFDTVSFVPVSNMISLGILDNATFSPVLSARLSYTVSVPLDPNRNSVRLWIYSNGDWAEGTHTNVTDRYIQFSPSIPGVYVAAMPKPPGFVSGDMRSVRSVSIPQIYPGQARYGTR